jgi:starch synthase (maltosyl-transferring)
LRFPDDPRRVAIEHVLPDVDGGRFAVKRVLGDTVRVEADIFTHGHDELAAVVEFRHAHDDTWGQEPMRPLGNDRWAGSFPVTRLGEYRFRVVACVDDLATWRRDVARKREAGQDVTLDLAEGAALEQRSGTVPERGAVACFEATSPVWVDRPLAGCSAWYEMFPRSASNDPARTGTFADVTDRLGYVAGMGFDVLYLPPIHPVGHTHRKGPDNAPVAGPDDPGSPWAIGSAEGGHTAVHPALGSLADFDRLVEAARAHGLELALDLAFQCSPDHPWVTEHPEWFRRRADGSIAYAENPPKRYEDIIPLDFGTDAWRELWAALLEVVEFWIGHEVRVFRVDNPHTKPFAFWEWLIAQVHEQHPDVIFLSEAFTRPRVMERLAKVGFTQSYTYFTWRTTRDELVDYFSQLTSAPLRDYFRPNVWPNTPDILHETLQHGTRATFLARFVLAAGLSASYGIYGPPFELQQRVAREPGSEEYLHSEKYEVRHWDLDRPDSLRHFIAHVNAIRRSHGALQRNDTLRFHDVDNDRLVCWTKYDPATVDLVMVVVNLDAHEPQAGTVHLDLGALGLDADQPYDLHDLLIDARYTWHGPRNYVRLDPRAVPAHLFAVHGSVRPGAGR